MKHAMVLLLLTSFCTERASGTGETLKPEQISKFYWRLQIPSADNGPKLLSSKKGGISSGKAGERLAQACPWLQNHIVLSLSLHCFRCDRAKSHADCTSSVKCSDLERYCVSQTQQRPGEELMISKWCSPECPRFIMEVKGANVSAECCQTDYCNSGGPSSVQSSCVLVTVATLASFFCILQKWL